MFEPTFACVQRFYPFVLCLFSFVGAFLGSVGALPDRFVARPPAVVVSLLPLSFHWSGFFAFSF